MTRSHVKTRSVVRLLATCLLSAGILWQLARYGLLDLALIKSAFLHNKVWIGMSVCTVGIMSFLAGIRFHRLLALFSVQASFKDAFISGFLSQALGQWMPGSMAVGEILRFGFMTGLAPGRNAVGLVLSTMGIKSRIGMASLLDRFLGFGTMLNLGSLAGLALIFQGKESAGASPAVPLLSAISLALGAAILTMPLLSGSVMHRLPAFFRKAGAEETTPGADSPLRRNAFIPRMMRWFRMMVETLGTSTTRRSWAVIPLLISAGIAIFFVI